jgi:hypothetical protein
LSTAKIVDLGCTLDVGENTKQMRAIWYSGMGQISVAAKECKSNGILFKPVCSGQVSMTTGSKTGGLLSEHVLADGLW